MPATQRMTADEYLALPYSEERRWVELVEGELIVDESLLLHQVVKVELTYALSSWARADEGRGLVSLPLAVEIRSASTWRYDIGAKKAAYERAGLRELWLVDTAASEVVIFRRSRPDAPAFEVALELERTDKLTSPQLEGFELALAELFPE